MSEERKEESLVEALMLLCAELLLHGIQRDRYLRLRAALEDYEKLGLGNQPEYKKEISVDEMVGKPESSGLKFPFRTMTTAGTFRKEQDNHGRDIYILEDHIPQPEKKVNQSSLEKLDDHCVDNMKNWRTRRWQREHDRLMLEEVDRRIESFCGNFLEKHSANETEMMKQLKSDLKKEVAEAAVKAIDRMAFGGRGKFWSEHFIDALEGKE